MAKKNLRAPENFINRELSWLRFARRVLELAEDDEVPLLERVKFAGILGMLHDDPIADVEIGEWCSIAKVLHDLQRARIGHFGHPIEHMLDMQTDQAAL